MPDIIEKPICIIGCPRSGTSFFHLTLSYHPDMGYFSTPMLLFPRYPWLSFSARIADLPRIGNIYKRLSLNRNYLPRPVEAIKLWQTWCPGFYPTDHGVPKRPTSEDVSDKCKKNMQQVIQKTLTWQGKDRFIMKNTGYPRIEFLNEIFHDSIFIHVIRDGRAVVNSYLNEVVKQGWNLSDRELDAKAWSENFQEDWIASDKSKIVFAANQYKHFINAILEEKNVIPKERYIEIRYEDFVKRPKKIIDKTMEFAELEWKPEYEDFIDSIQPQNNNYKWKTHFSEEEKHQLNATLVDFLKKLSYSD